MTPTDAMLSNERKLNALADACERHAWHHFTAAHGNITETAVDLSNIDRGLACLERAATLRAKAAMPALREALEAISSQAICYGMRADETELRDWLKFISETAESALSRNRGDVGC